MLIYGSFSYGSDIVSFNILYFIILLKFIFPISYVDRFPEPGETLCGNFFRKGFGGKAANACVMAARLGLECRMLAKVN